MTRGIARRWPVVLVAIVALVASACGGGGDDGGGGGIGPGQQQDGGDQEDAGDDEEASATKKEGCELVTAEDAEEILGEPVQQGEGGTPGLEVATCIWEVQRETSSKLLLFQVFEGEQFYGEDAFKDGEGFERVDGVGDRAFFYDLAGPALQVLDGDTMVTISVTIFDFGDEQPLDEAAVKQQMTDLAKTVLSRL